MRTHILAAFMIVVAASFAAGATTSQDSLPSVAVTADHPLYDVKTGAEQMVEELAPNASAKARSTMEHATKRIAEANVLAERNETELVNETLQNYTQKLADVRQIADQISSAAQRQDIDAVIANATSIHTEVLSAVYEKVPSQAKDAIKRAMNKSVVANQVAIADLRQGAGNVTGMNLSAMDASSHVPDDLKGSVGLANVSSYRPDGGSGGQNGTTRPSGSGSGSGSTGQAYR